MAVGEAHEVPRPRDLRIGVALAFVGHLDESGRRAQQLSEPGRRFVARIHSLAAVPPDRDRPNPGPGLRPGAGHGQRRESGRFESQAFVHDPYANEHEARVLASGEEPPSLVGHHPAPVANEPSRLDAGGVQGHPRRGLHRIDGDRGELAGNHLQSGGAHVGHREVPANRPCRPRVHLSHGSRSLPADGAGPAFGFAPGQDDSGDTGSLPVRVRRTASCQPRSLRSRTCASNAGVNRRSRSHPSAHSCGPG